jgi:hypothetical protein
VGMRTYDTSMSRMALFIILCYKKCGFDNHKNGQPALAAL